jgi:hypothetical protein
LKAAKSGLSTYAQYGKIDVATVHKTLLVIDGDGVTLATYNNALVFRSREIKLTAVPVEIRTILMVGYVDQLPYPR